MIIRKIQLGALMCLAITACSENGITAENQSERISTGPEFEYLSSDENSITTLHMLKYEIRTNGDHKIAGPKHRTDVFGGTPYEISLAAFIGAEAALMIHAERVADGSGASDYSNLPIADWPDEKFRSDGFECMEIPTEAIDGEHDLEWLRANGFEPSGVIMFGQYFATTDGFNDEIVLSLLQHVESCESSASNQAAVDLFKSDFSITQIN